MTVTTDFEHLSIVSNGTAPPAGPRIPRREEWLELPEEYAGFKVLVWVNYPRRLNDELSSGDQERIKAALLKVVLAHNDWCDEDGAPLPRASDEGFWEAIPDELAASIIVLLTVTVGKLAASIRARSTR
jgi:hypothetical protein